MTLTYGDKKRISNYRGNQNKYNDTIESSPLLKHFLIFAFKVIFADNFAHDLNVELGQWFKLYLMTRVIKVKYALEKEGY